MSLGVKRQFKSYLHTSNLDSKFDSLHTLLSTLIQSLESHPHGEEVDLPEVIRDISNDLFQPSKSDPLALHKKTLPDIRQLRQAERIVALLLQEGTTTPESGSDLGSVLGPGPVGVTMPILPDFVSNFEGGGIGLDSSLLLRLQLSLQRFVREFNTRMKLKKQEIETETEGDGDRGDQMDAGGFRRRLRSIRHVKFFGVIWTMREPYYIIETNYVGDFPKLKGGSGDEKIEGEERSPSPSPSPSANDGDEFAPASGRVTGTDNASGIPEYIVKLGGLVTPPEAPTVGTNRHAYWVYTSDPTLASEWIRLPDVTPAQIVISRRITKFMTGNLDSRVVSYPPFPGTESSLLRAIICRIQSGCCVAPRNVLIERPPPGDDDDELSDYGASAPPGDSYSDAGDLMGGGFGRKRTPDEIEIEESAPELVLNPEFAAEGSEMMEESDSLFLTQKQLMLLDSWVHTRHNLMRTGRVVKYKPPREEPRGDVDSDMEETLSDDGDSPFNAQDEQLPLLTGIEQDDGLEHPAFVPKSEMARSMMGDDTEGLDSGDEFDTMDDDDGRLRERAAKTFSAWDIRRVNDWHRKYSTIVVRNRRWPGAISFCDAGNPKIFGSLYVGYGIKHNGKRNVFTPFLPPQVEVEEDEPPQMTDPIPGDEKRVLQGEDPSVEEEVLDEEDLSGDDDDYYD